MVVFPQSQPSSSRLSNCSHFPAHFPGRGHSSSPAEGVLAFPILANACPENRTNNLFLNIRGLSLAVHNKLLYCVSFLKNWQNAGLKIEFSRTFWTNKNQKCHKVPTCSHEAVDVTVKIGNRDVMLCRVHLRMAFNQHSCVCGEMPKKIGTRSLVRSGTSGIMPVQTVVRTAIHGGVQAADNCSTTCRHKATDLR